MAAQNANLTGRERGLEIAVSGQRHACRRWQWLQSKTQRRRPNDIGVDHYERVRAQQSRHRRSRASDWSQPANRRQFRGLSNSRGDVLRQVGRPLPFCRFHIGRARSDGIEPPGGSEFEAHRQKQTRAGRRRDPECQRYETATSASGANRCLRRSRKDGSGDAIAGAISRSASVHPKTTTLVRPTSPPKNRSDQTQSRQTPAGCQPGGPGQETKPRGTSQSSAASTRREQDPVSGSGTHRSQHVSVAPATRSTNPIPHRRGRSDRIEAPIHLAGGTRLGPPPAKIVRDNQLLADAAAMNRPRHAGAMSSINRRPTRAACSTARVNPVQPNPGNHGQVQPIESGMHKDVAASSWFKGRCQATWLNPSLPRARTQRTNHQVGRRRGDGDDKYSLEPDRHEPTMRSQRARSDQIHHDQTTPICNRGSVRLYQPKVANASNPVSRLSRNFDYRLTPQRPLLADHQLPEDVRRFTIYGTDFPIDRVGDLPGRKRKPSLICMRPLTRA